MARSSFARVDPIGCLPLGCAVRGYAMPRFRVKACTHSCNRRMYAPPIRIMRLDITHIHVAFCALCSPRRLLSPRGRVDTLTPLRFCKNAETLIEGTIIYPLTNTRHFAHGAYWLEGEGGLDPPSRVAFPPPYSLLPLSRALAFRRCRVRVRRRRPHVRHASE